MHELILASQSPRRKQILSERGYEFRTFPIEVSEIPNKNLNLNDQISDMAKQKAQAAAAKLKSLKSQEVLILSADTVVLFDGKILGKPKNQREAILTLGQLSGRKHHVVTGFCLWDLGSERFILSHVVSNVEFRLLGAKEIQDYVATGEPMDKAGSYGIQGKAQKFVKQYSGSYNNIVGLPIEEIEKVMLENGWIIEKKS